VAALFCALLAGCGGHQATVAVPTPTRQATTALGNGLASATVFAEPGDKRTLLAGALRSATKSIDLTMYLLTDRTLIHDLEYAQGNGVRVRVILEHNPYGMGASSRSENQSAYNQLTAADIPVHWAPARFALTHEKTMIVDGATAYILTLNWTASAFSRNREFGVVDSNPVDVRAADAIFQADWNDTPYTPTDANLVLSPSNSRADFLSLIGRATKSIDVYAEEVQDSAVEAAFAAAQRRGVQVRLISNAGDASNAKGLAAIEQAGVQVHLLTSPYIHAKLIVVDGSLAFVGSENISAASLDRNRELGVMLRDRSAIASLEATFEHDWAR
jgi:phosphatidylserine/phosphatidylglycerophosphate/cardiolipin synthase-like enzyme